MTTRYEDLSIVIPAFNEEEGIKKVLDGITRKFPGAEIIVIDDGSSDDTLRNGLSIPNVIVLQHIFNRGYGAALKTGTAAATKDYVAWFDADNEHQIEDLVAMYDAIHGKPLAAVFAQRISKSVSGVRGVGKLLIRILARMLQFNAGHDLNCGLRIFRREIICGYLSLLPDGYSASLTTTVLFVERDYPIALHPVTTGQRTGTSKVVLSDGFAALMQVLNLIMLFAPMRIFFRGGMGMIVLGVGYSVARAVISGRGIPVAGMLATVIGVLVCMLGLIAQQISNHRLSSFTPSGMVRMAKRTNEEATDEPREPES